MSLESVFKLSLIMNMIDNLSGPMAGVASKVGANVSKLDAASQTFGSMAKAGAAMQEMGSQIVNAVLAPVEATFETRRALGELASLGVQDLEAVENAARSFSDQWAGTSKADFISAAYDIKSGIASLSDEGVAEFTSLAALTAKATKSTAGEMTSLFATGYGIYKDYYTFIDNLTGGKLSEIREKFSTAMSNIVQGISQKFTDARTAFSNGLNNIKNAVSGAVTWFFESGKRIVSTFANGIKSAFSSAVEAVKGGLQKIRNLLPFSDAKEGPLSTLTLSGQRTMTTYAHGLTLAGDAPAEAMNKSLQQVQGALDRKPEKKIDLGGGKKDKDESSDEGGSGKGKQVIIHKLLVPVDLKKIKDLQQLLALLQEVEDYAAANEDGEPGDDEDAVPAPA